MASTWRKLGNANIKKMRYIVEENMALFMRVLTWRVNCGGPQHCLETEFLT